MSKYAKEVNECLLRMQNGDASQLKDLYELTAIHLRKMVKVFVKNEVDCDDIVVETFIRIYKYIHSFNPEQDGYNWMCTIARNLIREFNKSGAEFRSFCEVQENEIASDCVIDQIDTKIDLSLATQHLDKINKTILWKRFYCNETLDEIAQELGISKTAVHKRLKRIIKEIEKYYKKR